MNLSSAPAGVRAGSPLNRQNVGPLIQGQGQISSGPSSALAWTGEYEQHAMGGKGKSRESAVGGQHQQAAYAPQYGGMGEMNQMNAVGPWAQGGYGMGMSGMNMGMGMGMGMGGMSGYQPQYQYQSVPQHYQPQPQPQSMAQGSSVQVGMDDQAFDKAFEEVEAETKEKEKEVELGDKVEEGEGEIKGKGGDFEA
jgi:hypothetical protein